MTRIPIIDKRSASRPEAPTTAPTTAAEPAAAPAADQTGAAPAEEARDRRLVAVEAERDEWRERALRLAAELDNLRKLVDQRVDNEVFRREQERLTRWLELGDVLDRALRQAATATPEWRRGLEDVVRTFDELLTRAGAVRIDTTGPFDPAVHEALAVVPDPTRENGAIAAVERAGWMLGDRLLRAAGVVVVRNRPA
ncbi:MAG: nucleotide exchange factor GrpE [Deltaproteobacteria bacterium]|nr:nucleotide exchange factor GrpE [Deltaproteobacteria bacterium]